MFSPFSVRQILWRPISMCRLHKDFVDVVVAVARTLSFHMCLYSSRRGHYNCRKSFRVLAFPLPLFLFGLCATKFSILPRGVRTLCSPNLSSKLAIFSVSRRRACWTISRVSLEAALQFLLAVAKSVRHSISSLRLRRFSSWTLASSSRRDQATYFHFLRRDCLLEFLQAVFPVFSGTKRHRSILGNIWDPRIDLSTSIACALFFLRVQKTWSLVVAVLTALVRLNRAV